MTEETTLNRTDFSRPDRLGRLAAAVAALLLALAVPAAAAQSAAAEVEPRAEGLGRGGLVFAGGDERAIVDLLNRITDAAPAPVAESADRFRSGRDLREELRATERAEASTELDEHLVEAANADDLPARAIALSNALRAALDLDVIAGVGGEDPLTDPRVQRLRTLAEQTGAEAESAGEWMLASELFSRLATLYEDGQPYGEDVDRLSTRLGMIRLYAPARFRELANEHRVRHGEEPFPAYNPFGDSYEEKLGPIRRGMVERAIQHAAFRHVERASLRDMLLGGLDALETFATTRDLQAVFPGLASERDREAFLRAIDEQRVRLANADRRATATDLNAVMSRVRSANGYSIKVDEQAIWHEFGNGAMSALDQFSAVIWPDEVKRFERSTQGAFVGVGIQIQMDELQNIKVVTPLEGQPAQRAGIQAGDLIKGVDGNPTAGFTIDQAVEVITGPENTRVTLQIERPAEEETGKPERLEFTITRQRIELPTVTGWYKTGAGDGPEAWDWFIDPDADIGYVRLSSFSEHTTRDFDRAIDAMRDAGLRGLVLDLRFNPGGLLDQAVSIGNRFIGSGLIVKTEDAMGQVQDRQFARSIPERKSLSDIPVVVLINQGSASASEIVAGAIQSHASNGGVQATIVGDRSFGKGSVQNVFPLAADASAYMKLTTQYYKLEGNRNIHRREGAGEEQEWGVVPNLRVEMLPDQIVEAARIRRDADVVTLDQEGNIVPDEDRPHPSELLEPGKDLQLQAALVLLHSQLLAPELARAAADARDGL